MGNAMDPFGTGQLDRRYGVLTTPDGKKRSMKPEDCRPRYYERTYREGDPELPEDPEFPAKLLQAAQDHDWKIENGADGVSIMYPGKKQPKLWVGHVRVLNPEDKICPENGNAHLSLDTLIHQGLITPVYKNVPKQKIPALGSAPDSDVGAQASEPTTATTSRGQSEEEAQKAGEESKASVNSAVNITAGTQCAPRGPVPPVHPAHAIYNNIPYPLAGSYHPAMPFPHYAPGYPAVMPTFPSPQYAAPSPVNRPPPVVGAGPCAPLLPIFSGFDS